MKDRQQNTFLTDIDALLDGKSVDLYRAISSGFEHICANMFHGKRKGGIWYDGVVGITVVKRKSHQLVIEGEMWIGDGPRVQWKEPFHAMVTDKRITRQGICLKVTVGEYSDEGDLFSIWK